MDNERRTSPERPGHPGTGRPDTSVDPSRSDPARTDADRPDADRSETARDIDRTVPPMTPPAPGGDRSDSMRQAPRTAGPGAPSPLSGSPRATATRHDGAQPDHGGTTPPTGPGRPAAGTTPSDPGHMEGASGLGTGAERPGAVSAGYPRTVPHSGPAPEAKATPRPASPRPDVTTANMSGNPSVARVSAKSNGIGGRSWITWGLIALAVLVVLWIIF